MPAGVPSGPKVVHMVTGAANWPRNRLVRSLAFRGSAAGSEPILWTPSSRLTFSAWFRSGGPDGPRTRGHPAWRPWLPPSSPPTLG